MIITEVESIQQIPEQMHFLRFQGCKIKKAIRLFRNHYELEPEQVYIWNDTFYIEIPDAYYFRDIK